MLNSIITPAYLIKIFQYELAENNEARRMAAKVTVFFSKVGQSSRSQGQQLSYHVKGLVTRNDHLKYESPVSFGLKVMTKVKVVVLAHTPTRTGTGLDSTRGDGQLALFALANEVTLLVRLALSATAV